MRIGFRSALLTAALLMLPAGALAQDAQSDEDLIKTAESAAPAAVAQNATIIAMDEQMNVRTLREGTNGFTCMPDDAGPGKNPMCLDENGMAWAEALMGKSEPPEGKVGFGYMLAGGETPSNTDPYATEPAGGELGQEPPHVMIFNYPELPAEYPQPGDSPDRTQPYVMWAGTPYEHLMIPVE